MPYMLTILEPHDQRKTRTESEGHALFEQMVEFGAKLKERGQLRAMESLRPDHRGKRVQVRAGKQKLIDGPFTEAREMIGGFFLIDCASMDEALAIAAQCPAAEWATVEVRETGPCYES